MPLPTPKTARLFTIGCSQAASLPAEFRFAAERVYVHRDARTGDVIRSTAPRPSWAEFMALRNQLGSLPGDFLTDRQQGGETRDPLSGWRE